MGAMRLMEPLVGQQLAEELLVPVSQRILKPVGVWIAAESCECRERRHLRQEGVAPRGAQVRNVYANYRYSFF